MTERMRVAGAAAAIAMIAGLLFLDVHPDQNPAKISGMVLAGAAWAVFAAGAWLVRGISVRRSVGLIVVGGVLIQLVAVSAPPRESDDLYRYIWDGRVQAAGIDPYQYVPAARELAGLRDPFLWHAGGGWCVHHGSRDPDVRGETLVGGCTMINRPKVHTIYPPVAEAYFLALHYVTPAGFGSTPVRAAAGLCAILITLLLLFGLGYLGRDKRLAVLWAWCPAVALEAGNNGHVDVLAAGLTAAALFVLARAGSLRRTFAGGVLLGLAVATKVTPILITPAVLRRRWAAVAFAVAGSTGAVYLPHVIAVGPKVLGFLPGYLNEEGYNDGSRFVLLGVFLRGWHAIAAALVILAVTGLLALRFADPDRPWRAALVMTGVTFAVTTPNYPWYGLLLVVLVAIDGRAEWLGFAVAGYVGQAGLPGEFHLDRIYAERIAYAAAVIGVAAVWLARRTIASRRSDDGRPPAQLVPATPRAPVTVASG